MASGVPMFKCRCMGCGWTSKRALKNVARPCPKCKGNNVQIPHGPDREEAKVVVAIAAGFMIVMAIIFTALGR